MNNRYFTQQTTSSNFSPANFFHQQQSTIPSSSAKSFFASRFFSRKSLALILGLILSIAFLIIAFRLLQENFSLASNIEPQNVIISEITENSAKIQWKTAVETQGVIEYGTTPTNLNFFAPETQKTKDHTVELTLLSPGTSYYFKIRIGNKLFDNAGVPWTFTTKAKDKERVFPLTNITPPPYQRLTIPITATPTPTPYQRLRIDPTPTPTPTLQPISDCGSLTDCDLIRQYLGKGCSTQDYIKCLLNLTPTPGQ